MALTILLLMATVSTQADRLDDFVRGQRMEQEAPGTEVARSLHHDTTATYEGFSFHANFLS
jgi:hypothetical protein